MKNKILKIEDLNIYICDSDKHGSLMLKVPVFDWKEREDWSILNLTELEIDNPPEILGNRLSMFFINPYEEDTNEQRYRESLFFENNEIAEQAKELILEKLKSHNEKKQKEYKEYAERHRMRCEICEYYYGAITKIPNNQSIENNMCNNFDMDIMWDINQNYCNEYKENKKIVGE